MKFDADSMLTAGCISLFIIVFGGLLFNCQKTSSDFMKKCIETHAPEECNKANHI